MGERPETSTAAVALRVAGAALDLIPPDPHADPETRLEHVVTIIRGARDLRPHQVDDVVEFLTVRLDTGRTPPPDERQDV